MPDAPPAADAAVPPTLVLLEWRNWLPPTAAVTAEFGSPALAFAVAEARRLLAKAGVRIPAARETGRRSVAAEVVLAADSTLDADDLWPGLLAVLVALGAVRSAEWSAVRLDALRVVRGGGAVGTVIRIGDLPAARKSCKPVADPPPIRRGRVHRD